MTSPRCSSLHASKINVGIVNDRFNIKYASSSPATSSSRKHLSILLTVNTGELLILYCTSFGVLNFIQDTSTSAERDADDWGKLDSLFKLWIFGTISKSLLQRVLKKNTMSHDVWKQLKDVFHDNKSARAMQLDNDLWNVELGNLLITNYFHKILCMADLLANIDSEVDEKNLVFCAINGLGEKYDQVAGIIRHRDPTPTFSQKSHNTPRDNLSFGSILMAQHNRSNTNTNSQQVRRNFQRDHSSYGPLCKYLHVASGSNRNGGHANTRVSVQQGILGPVQHTSPRAVFGPNGMQGPAGPPGFNWTSQASYGSYMDQSTSLPQSFNTMTLPDYGDSSWYMDTGATSHLASDAGSDLLLRCKSNGDLYPVLPPTSSNTALVSTNQSTWHQRLGHSGYKVLRFLVFSNLIDCNKPKTTPLSHVCQLGKHVSQQKGIDCDETFSQVVKLANIHTVFSLAISRTWPIHQLDVKNTFLHAHLFETVYMHRPPGFHDPTHLDYLAKLLGSGSFFESCLSLYSLLCFSTVTTGHVRVLHVPSWYQYAAVTTGHVRVLHVPSWYQYADIFTKGLPSPLFTEFRSSLSVCPAPAPTTGAY
uniref:Reverse transcriptase Ty1/copia-type domain-containing protein n=1 Tax=Tanacetum cinerariifolium TaxID=118510 RepID=A0A699GXH8_TANCI|nr:hypothetical protein [Tanacetum cinerariifolium]